MRRFALIVTCLCCIAGYCNAQSLFVKRQQGHFTIEGKPYRYIGTNYWYGSLLALQKDKKRGISRLRKELDFLQKNGITNLRVLGGVEGTAIINGFPRVQPPLQTQKNIFDTAVLYGLDVLLDEMRKRGMKAVVFLSNNWEWSGGFLQYLNWNHLISDSVLQAKMNWDDMRDHISRFYTCRPCMDDYRKQAEIILRRKNTVNGREYIDDPTIMSWELANEPRPMRPASNDAYREWISSTAAFVKSIDRNHLVCLGHEGSIGTQSMQLFEDIHRDADVDYLTIHIWPRNWGWLRRDAMEEDFGKVLTETTAYIDDHVRIAERLDKPLVIEEFGLPRDDTRFTPGSPTKLRDRYYDTVFSFMQHYPSKKYLAGINFWAFNGIARPKKGQVFWKPGDDYMGDPPMEEQSLYGVFDNDNTTWKVIAKHLGLLQARVAIKTVK